MSDTDDQSARPPRLTIGQRLLAALPNLQDRGARPGAAGAEVDDGPDTAPRAARPASGSRGGAMADAADDADADKPAAEDATGEDDGATRTRRPAATGAGRAPSPYQDWKPEQLRRAMKYLDDRERRLAIMAGPLLMGLNIALTFVTLHNNHRFIAGRLNKAYETPSTIIALGIGSAVVAAIVVVSAVVRRRSFTIFALLFAGYGGGPVTLLPSWGLAAWLFIRFNRMQKVLRTKEGGPAGRGGAARGSTARGTGRGGATARARASTNPRAAARAGAAAGRDRVSARRRGKEPAPAGPTPSKRYTPPKPPRPRPPPPES